MHAYYSDMACGDTVCLATDEIGDIPSDERELGMITAVTFTASGLLYGVTWSDRSDQMHTPPELFLLVRAGEKAPARRDEE